MLGNMGTYIICSGFIVALYGCVSSEGVSREALPAGEKKIREVVTVDGTLYTFKKSPEGYGALMDSTIVGVLESGRKVKIPLSSVSQVQVVRPDLVKGLLVGLGALALTGSLLVFMGMANFSL